MLPRSDRSWLARIARAEFRSGFHPPLSAWLLLTCWLSFTPLVAAQSDGGVSLDDLSRPGGVYFHSGGLVLADDEPPTPTGTAPIANRRYVSLRRLDRCLLESDVSRVEQLPAEIRYLGGLTRIEAVLVYPQQRDLVLVGPAEDPDEIVAGSEALRIDDLALLWQRVRRRNGHAFGCSIEPTLEGRQRWRLRAAHSPPPTTRQLAEALGEQQIRVLGIAGDTHLAHQLVAADIHLKRGALGLEPLLADPALPSLDPLVEHLLGQRLPRVWIYDEYEPLQCSSDTLVWSLRGELAVRVHVEGYDRLSGSQRRRIESWADHWTERMPELADRHPAFRALQALADLSVATALISRFELTRRAEWQPTRLTRASHRLWQTELPIPRTTPSVCRITRGGDRRFVVAGGVLLQSWQHVQVIEEAVGLGDDWAAGQPPQDSDAWFWDHRP